MIEEYTIHGKHVVSLSVVHNDPVRVLLCDTCGWTQNSNEGCKCAGSIKEHAHELRANAHANVLTP
jgi:hypothetical protein